MIRFDSYLIKAIYKYCYCLTVLIASNNVSLSKKNGMHKCLLVRCASVSNNYVRVSRKYVLELFPVFSKYFLELYVKMSKNYVEVFVGIISPSPSNSKKIKIIDLKNIFIL